MEQVVIYGAGNNGKSAYYHLKNIYECLFFVDGDSKKWGQEFAGLQIKRPEILKKMKNIKIIVASIYWKEILKEIKDINWLEIMVYKPGMELQLSQDVKKELGERTINLGSFLENRKEIICKELTFMPGGSQVLDYAFLKVLAEKYNCKKYLEIGTYIGESINILTDCCDKLYSITALPGDLWSMTAWCKEYNVPNYSERLTYSNKIVHFFTDSKSFDYSQIEDDIDLYFIDGDHSYSGVYSDTKNVFAMKKEDAIVVWHDFRKKRFLYNPDVVSAVRDALGDRFKNVYVTDNNICGIYLPDSYIKDFVLRELKYEEKSKLYTYDLVLNNCQVK